MSQFVRRTQTLRIEFLWSCRGRHCRRPRSDRRLRCRRPRSYSRLRGRRLRFRRPSCSSSLSCCLPFILIGHLHAKARLARGRQIIFGSVAERPLLSSRRPLPSIPVLPQVHRVCIHVDRHLVGIGFGPRVSSIEFILIGCRCTSRNERFWEDWAVQDLRN